MHAAGIALTVGAQRLLGTDNHLIVLLQGGKRLGRKLAYLSGGGRRTLAVRTQQIDRFLEGADLLGQVRDIERLSTLPLRDGGR